MTLRSLDCRNTQSQNIRYPLVFHKCLKHNFFLQPIYFVTESFEDAKQKMM